jgi:hypothetical protein
MGSRNRRTKKVSAAQNIGQLGVTLVQGIVQSMGFVWNELHFESGIDGIIEVVDTATSTPTNRVVMVQVKAVLSSFQSESGDALSFSCERAHIQYWLGGTAPVILVVCRPRTQEAYWKDIKAYFSDPANLGSVTVRFDKQADRFDPSVAGSLADLATPSGGHYLGLLPKEETLISNLFPVTRTPDTIWSGTAVAKRRDAFTAALKDLKRPDLRELTYSAGTIYSFHDLRSQPLASLVEPGSVEGNPSEDWAKTNDPDLKRQFVDLLNRSFRQFCFAKNIFYDYDTEVLYCGIDRGAEKREVRCPALQNEGTRALVNWYPSKKEGYGFYRHHALIPRFLRLDGVWYLEVTPTYFFSTDGFTRYRFSEDSLAGIKRLEKHRSVLGHLLMWKWLFCDKALVFDRKYDDLELAEPLTFKVTGGIDDAAWLKGGGDDSESEFTVDEENDDEQGTLELW